MSPKIIFYRADWKKMKLTGQYFQVAGRLVLVLTTSYDIKNAVIGVCGVRVRRDSVLYV